MKTDFCPLWVFLRSGLAVPKAVARKPLPQKVSALDPCICTRCVPYLYFSLMERMHILWALLLLTLAPGCSILPTNGNSIRNTMDRLIYIAETTLVHIKELRTNLPVASHIKLSTPSIDGLTSISRDLGLLSKELQNPFTDLLSQIQADVSSLEGLMRYFAQTMSCPIQARPGGHTVDLSFPDSQISITLMKVELYLDTFLLHKDKLKVC